VSEQEAIGQHHERMGASTGDREEGIVQLIRSANLRHGVQRYPQSPARSLYCIKRRYDGRIARIPEYGDARDLWDCLLEKLQPFPF
jgi:hypothetical protein